MKTKGEIDQRDRVLVDHLYHYNKTLQKRPKDARLREEIARVEGQRDALYWVTRPAHDGNPKMHKGGDDK